MNRAVLLFLVLAAVSLVAAQPGNERPAIKPADKGVSVVPEERVALAKLHGIHANYIVASTGHITYVDVGPGQTKSSEPLDLGFLSDLAYLEDLYIWQVPVAGHGMDGAAKLERLAELRLEGPIVGDEHMVVLGKMQHLRILHFGRLERQRRRIRGSLRISMDCRG